MSHTELDLIVAELMFPVLVELAPTGKTIRYKEMADLIKSKNPNVIEISNITQRHIGRKLGTIWEFTKSQKCPHIGALVVNQSGECGSGISTIVSDLPKEREKIKKYDWSSVTLGFESYISKAKIIKAESEEKVIKRTRDEAKECFISYWKKIKEDAPVSKDEILAIKEKILQLVQNGLSPEEAFSQELIAALKNKQKNTPSNGYVYIGEYINAETGQPLFDQLKIGYTSNLDNRAIALSGGVNGPLQFIIKYFWEFNSNIAYAIEQSLHGRFSKFRKNGEFFINTSGLLPELADDEITKKYGELLMSSNYE